MKNGGSGLVGCGAFGVVLALVLLFGTAFFGAAGLAAFGADFDTRVLSPSTDVSCGDDCNIINQSGRGNTATMSIQEQQRQQALGAALGQVMCIFGLVVVAFAGLYYVFTLGE